MAIGKGAGSKGMGSGVLAAAKLKLADIAATQRAKAATQSAGRATQRAAAAVEPAGKQKPQGAGNSAVSATTARNAIGATADSTAAAKKTTKARSSVAASSADSAKPRATGKSDGPVKSVASASSSKPAVSKTAGKAVTGATSAASTAAAQPPAKPPATARQPRRITAEQALANTRSLLSAKNEQAHQPQTWQAHDPQHGHSADVDFQSADAMAKATELHLGESNKDAIHGSSGSQDRHQQGRRDSR